MQVIVKETRPLKYIKTPPIRSGNDIRESLCDLDPHATITKVDSHTHRVVFSPSVERQKELAYYLGTPEDEGLSGQFVVQYDFERDSTGGDVRFFLLIPMNPFCFLFI